MASIKERKDKDGKTRYYVQIRLRGGKHQCASFLRLTDARKWIQDTESAIRDGRHFKTSEAKKHNMAEMIDRYIENVLPNKQASFTRQRAQLIWWKEQIGHVLLSEISPAMIAEQRDKLLKGMTVKKELRGNATVNRYLAILSHVFTIAAKEWGWTTDNPLRHVSKPKEPKGRVRFLSEEERERLLAACKESSNPYLYTAVVLSIASGMRQSECLNLTWSSCDLEKGRIVLEKTKNGERRSIPISGHALQLLKDLHNQRTLLSPLVFPSAKNPMKPADMRGSWETALKKGGIENFCWHCLRHTTASYLAQNSASLAVISEVLGHKTLAMVKRYAHIGESHAAEVVASMNEKVFG